MTVAQKKTTSDDALILYAELTAGEIRAVQRRRQSGELKRIATGVITSLPEESWPPLIARERIPVLAALYPPMPLSVHAVPLSEAPRATG